VSKRPLLIHGARAALPPLSQSDTSLGRWLKAMIERGVHCNAVVAALADKLPWIAWATLEGNIFRALLCRRGVIGSAARVNARSPRGLQEDCEDGPTVDRRLDSPVNESALYVVDIMTLQTRGCPSWPWVCS
jgi:hypothetical protein